MKEKRFYLIYKITNNLNQKFYIGKHETDNLDDDYFGSGKYLNRAKEKYGLENFTKTILFYCANREEMNLLEHCVVTPEFCQREDVYNINEGGDGGWHYANQILTTTFRKNITKRGGKNLQQKYKKLYGISITAFTRLNNTENDNKSWNNAISESLNKWHKEHPEYFAGKNNPMYGHKHKQKTRIKMSNLKQGKKNNRYGSKWYYDPLTLESRSFLPNEEIPNGWIKGRKIKR